MLAEGKEESETEVQVRGKSRGEAKRRGRDGRVGRWEEKHRAELLAAVLVLGG
jgi:hypothetical protein